MSNKLRYLFDTNVCGHASCVVSGDADLLAMNPFRGIPILTPAQFLDLLAREDV